MRQIYFQLGLRPGPRCK